MGGISVKCPRLGISRGGESREERLGATASCLAGSFSLLGEALSLLLPK